MAKKCLVLVLAATIAALGLRLPRLQQRPMHGDEAIHAFKFGELLEKGYYRYDPNEYHGPTLNYLTLVPAWLSSVKKFIDLSESTLRIVPVFFGVLLVLLILLIIDGLGRAACVIAAVLTAISPAMVFYSRYYIQEMLLVCFSFGIIACGYRYTQRKNTAWALLIGVFLGLCHATKETSLILFGSILMAFCLTLYLEQRRGRSVSLIEAIRAMKPIHFIALVAAGVIVAALFYSSFLSNPGGIWDSIRTYTTYFRRARLNQLHEHPWYYYLKMLIYFKYGSGRLWSEAFIVLLAVVGFVVAMKGRGATDGDLSLLKFIGFYTLIMTVLYSVIRYKTPWCMLGFLHGMILLAGVGAVALIKLMPNKLGRIVIGLLLVGGGVHLGWQAYLGSYKAYADSRNPYVYAHPTTDVFAITKRVQELAKVHPDGHKMQIQVICPDHDYWPLPWYLRSLPNIAWWDKVVNDVASAPLIIASPSVEAALNNKFFVVTPLEDRQMYFFLFDEPYYMWLRPKIKLLGLVRKDLWDSYQQYQPDKESSQSQDEK